MGQVEGLLGTHSEASAALGSCGIQEKTWQAKDELERCGKTGSPKMGLTWEEVEALAQDRLFVASTCGPMHR